MSDFVLRVFYVAVCMDCSGIVIPFDGETERDEWARDHAAANGHWVRHRTDRLWRAPTIIEHDLL